MAAASDVRVKKEEGEKEEDVGPMDRHSHRFTVRFGKTVKKYAIDCDQPRTVLEAIKSNLNEQWVKNKCTDEKLIIQLSEKGRESIVATHFPCSCVQNDECLIVHCKEQEVEKPRSQDDEILPREQYSVFCVATKGGGNAMIEQLFQSNLVKKFDYLCVYAKKGTTVKEALERDGRFVDLQDFELSEVDKSDEYTVCKQKVDNLDQKKFKICLERKIEKEQVDSEQQGQQHQPSASTQSQQKLNTRSLLEKAKQSRISVGRAMEESGSTVKTQEVYKLLCEQFPDLKKWMESRFPGDSYQEQLKLKKENFGKIEQSFSEVQRLVNLSQLGKSVCLLKINAFRVKEQGTGFVLFDNLILTNAHLFKACADLLRDKWRDHVKITAEFNYEKPDCEPHKKEFNAKLLGGIDVLDYAILELDVGSQSSNQPTETGEANVPPGLLSRFGPLPPDGGACLIGHPAGGVKKIDLTCIIVKEERETAVNQNVEEYKNIFTLCAINEAIRKDPYADIHVTYNTFMYHGSSGSPVFDAHGRVFGLHSGGFFFDRVKPKASVIEFAYPLLMIFRSFVDELRKSGNNERLRRVQEEAEGNPYLHKIIMGESLTEGLDAEEDMATSEAN